MAKKNLSRELIVSVAFQMIDEKGKENFSVRQLATKLGVQVSSLYNYIKNEYDLLLEVAKMTANVYTEYIKEQAVGLNVEEATYKGGDGFRLFLKEHKFLYELMIDPCWIGNPEFDKAIDDFSQPLYLIIKMHGVKNQEDIDNMYVAIRTITHGFSTLDSLGVFDNLSVDPTESYHMMIKSVIDMMKNLSSENQQ